MNLRRTLKSNRGFLAFLLSFALLRTAVADWNPIPSGSMRPTLLEGDVVLVNRLAYDLKLPLTDLSLLTLGKPRRGDVVTLTSPATGVRLIKRIVGLPGDRLELRDEVLILNGAPATYTDAATHGEVLGGGWVVDAVASTEHLAGQAHRVQTLPAVAGARRSFAEITVPAGQYFVMGDNRDNSEDSRYIGPVPRDHLIGRAHHVLVSADILDRWQPRLARWAGVIH